MRYLTMLFLLLMGLIVLPAVAQENPPPLAAVTNQNIWLYGFGGEPQKITDDHAARYANLVWSPDGSSLAFVALDENFAASLWLYHSAKESLTQVDSGVQAGYAISFTPDANQLVYAKDSTPPGADPSNPLDVYTYDVNANSAPVHIATVDVGEGCGGGSSFAADWRYWDETEGLGGFHIILELTSYGLVYSKDCGYQTAVFDVENGEDVSLGSISRVDISADQRTLAGINYLTGDRTNEKLVLVDLETREVSEVETAAMPDQVTWTASGLFYSARQMTDQMLVSSDEELQRVNEVLGTSGQAHAWAVSIHHLDLATNTDTEIYSAAAYAIGKMSADSNGNLIFSQIPNAETWIAEVASGNLDLTDPVKFSESANLIPVQLFSLPIDGDIVEIGIDLNKAAINLQ